MKLSSGHKGSIARRPGLRPGAIFSVLSAAFAAACTGTAVPETGQDGSPFITFFASTEELSETKAILDRESFSTEGNRITVYDKHTVDGNPKYDMYINGQEAEYSPLIEDGAVTLWNFRDGDGYRKYWWTRHGTHSFTAFTSRYSEGNVIYNIGDHLDVSYDEDTEGLTVKGTLDVDTQFDFCYAHHSRDLDDINDLNPHRPVSLELEHLFAAVQFNIMNLVPDQQPAVTELGLTDIYRKGTADISKYSGNGGTAAVEYGLSSNGNITVTIDSDNTLVPSVLKNLLSGIGSIGADGSMLVWPHTNAELDAASASIKLSNPDSRHTFSLTTPEVTRWDAGSRYIYNIYIQDNNISFSVKVVDWKTDDIILEE